MKRKENKKFDLEKFEIAKLKNQRTIIGGTGDATNTDTGGDKVKDKDNSSLSCLLKDFIGI
ncbi:hypothetical protein FIA58_011645 [Flavobacterium jejuense]|uniref:Uncharacterized protein n=1 Tax=Flavobacterium jejuense TaxID=1544455 RepID=A0ABX0IRJ9_9FLAO|nr:hypothetical protein [Flavobacterium jejuense]NHN26333.1 hypothetical protein [Flavobacterium jejuense]